MADLKSETLRRLTASTLGYDQPSLSPDGGRLAFTTVADDYDLIDAALGRRRAAATLTANSRNELSPSWSPDGEQIVYSTDRTGEREIWMRNLKAGIDRPMVTAREFPPGTTTALADPVFSPDGSRFAFVRYSTNEPVTVWFEPSVGGAPDPPGAGTHSGAGLVAGREFDRRAGAAAIIRGSRPSSAWARICRRT